MTYFCIDNVYVRIMSFISEDYFNEHSVRLDGEKFNGNGMFIGLSRNTENWRTYLGYKYIDPKYRADVGFSVKNDRKWLTYFQSSLALGFLFFQTY